MRRPSLFDRARPVGAPGSTTVRYYLLWLVLAPLVATLLLAAFLLQQAYGIARERTEQQLLNTSRALAMVLDRQLGQYEASLKALATSPSIAEGDLPAFHAQASRVAPPASWIVLRRRDGRQLVDTRVPFGATPPLGKDGPAFRTKVMTVDVAVPRTGGPAFDLSLAFTPDILNRMLAEQRLPASWYGVILDRGDTVVGRTRQPERFVGAKATADLRERLKSSREGVKESVSLEGVETLLAYSRSSRFGWPVLVGAPRAEIFSGAWRSLLAGLAICLVLLCLGTALAFTFSARLRRQIRALAAAAGRLGGGERVEIPRFEIAELEAVGAALLDAASRLEKSEARLALAESAGEIGLWEWDRTAGRVWWSEGLYTLLDFDHATPATTENFLALVHPDDRGRGLVQTALLSEGEAFESEMRIRRPDGSERWLASRGRRIVEGGSDRIIGINFDVTARKAAEEALRRLNDELEHRVSAAAAERTVALEQLHEAQKLETMGLLTGGVAHDFNNLLTPIVGGLDFLKGRVAGDPKMSRVLEGAATAAERARILVSRLLAFARRQTLEPRPVDVGALILDISDLLQRSLGPQIDIAIDAQPGLFRATVDPNQLELAVLNLGINARDAMPGGGKLAIAVGRREEARGEAGGLEEGRYICLSVEDNGVGMDADTLKRAIEPFFSTKGPGRGTGLGLSMVHGLAGQSGGTLRLSSTPGTGTRAELWLPETDAAVEATEAAEERAFAVPRDASILLVDDDDMVRDATAAMLVEIGYRVEMAGSPEEAVAAVADRRKIDAVVTDYLMPGSTGAELIHDIRRIRPGLPALVITGYSGAAADIPSDVRCLAKPFRQRDLAKEISGLLDAKPNVISFPSGTVVSLD